MSELNPALDQYIATMPKVELHVHLEGTVLPYRLADLSARHGIALPAQDEADLAQAYRFRDFLHFIELWVAINECLRKPEDFAQIVVDL
ncbi:MAG TPA: hypothetical protein VKB09_13860, partial [Thermomicrobiales bacterium]|nr:hypothetical protein [Thermomicrobiales bacterium]